MSESSPTSIRRLKFICRIQASLTGFSPQPHHDGNQIKIYSLKLSYIHTMYLDHKYFSPWPDSPKHLQQNSLINSCPLNFVSKTHMGMEVRPSNGDWQTTSGHVSKVTLISLATTNCQELLC